MSDIWYLLQDSDRYVYHYTKARSLLAILRDHQLRFSKFAKVDDPYEYQNWVFGFRGLGNEDIDFAPLEEKLNYTMKHSWRAGCFARDIDAAVMGPRNERGSETLMRVHHRGHSLPAMWALYAENHAGACLIFDRIKLNQRVRESASTHGSLVRAKPVQYENHPVVGNDVSKEQALRFPLDEARRIGLRDAIDQHIAKHEDRLFFLKSRNWMWQQEFRWVVRSDGPEDFHVSFGDALVGVALGARFPKPELDEFCQLAKGCSHVSCSTMCWQNGVPYFDVAPPDLIMQREGFSQRMMNTYPEKAPQIGPGPAVSAQSSASVPPAPKPSALRG
jgi:hypothetical protein